MKRAFALTLIGIAVLTVSCRQTEPAKQAPPAESALDISIQPVNVPAAGDSGHAQLTASDRGVILSWLERKDDSATLKFSELAADAWGPATTVASSNNWFVTEADVPAVMRMSDGRLVATTYPSVDPEIEAYDLQLSYSRDEGKTWSKPFTPHHDRKKAQHGFASLFEMPDRALGMVWLDGRTMEPETADPQRGAMSVYFASFDAGWKQTAESSIDARVCECCPTAATMTADGPIVAFRDRTNEEIRDIHVARLDRPSTSLEGAGTWTAGSAVHADNWRIEACPVNGPALAARGRTAVVAWFTGCVGNDGHAYAAFSQDAGRTWGEPIRLDDHTSLGRVDIELADDGSAVATWVEFANERAQLSVRQVKPSGERSKAVGDRRRRRRPRPRLSAARAGWEGSGLCLVGIGQRPGTAADQSCDGTIEIDRQLHQLPVDGHCELVDDFAGLPAPAESVPGAVQRQHANLMGLRVARRVALDDDVVADLQRVSVHTLAAELAGAAPLDRVAHDRAVLFLHVHVHPGVRVTEHELDQIALDRHHPVFEVGGSKGVVCVRLRADQTSRRRRAERPDSASYRWCLRTAVREPVPTENTPGNAGLSPQYPRWQ